MKDNCTCKEVNRCPYAFETHTDKLICQRPTKQDLEGIAEINRIVKNVKRMNRLEQKDK
jgi:hypothetical protein